MALQIMLSLASLVFLLSSPSTVHAGLAQNKRAINFIRNSCKPTKHPDLCFNALSPFAGTIKNKPDKLTVTCISESLSKAQQAEAFIIGVSLNMTNNKSSHQHIIKALEICSKSFSDAQTELRGANMFMIKPGRGENRMNTLNDVKRLLSLVSDFEKKCMDAWNGMGQGTTKEEVTRRTSDAQMLNAVAVDLANTLK